MNTQKTFSYRYGDWVVNKPWLTLVLSILVVMGLGYGGSRLSIDTDFRSYFGPNNPQLKNYDYIESTFNKKENIIFMLSPKTGDVLSDEMLKMQLEMTEAAWQLPFSSRVNSLTNFQYMSAEGDDLLVEDLISEDYMEDDKFQPEYVSQVRERILSEPLLINRMVKKDLKNSSIVVNFQVEGKSETETPEIIAAERELIAEFNEKYPNVDIYSTGGVHISNAFSEAAQKDMQTLVPLMILIIAITCWFMLRSFTGTVSTLIIVGMSVSAAFGIAGFAGVKLTPPSMTSSIMIMTLAIADCIHVLVTAINNMRKGMEKKTAIIDSVRLNFMPVMITSLTTMLGFLSINFADSPPLNDLGNIAAVGMLAAFVLSITTLPALMTVMPMRVKASQAMSTVFMDKLANFVIGYRWPVLIITGFVTVGLSFFSVQNKGDDDFIKYFDDTYRFRVHTDHIEQELVSFYRMLVPMKSGEADGVSNPAFLQKMARFEDWLREQPETIHVSSLVETYKKLNQNMNGGNEAFYKLPDDKELAAQYMLMYEMSLPYGLDLTDQLELDKSSTILDVILKPLSAARTREFVGKVETWLYSEYPEFEALGVKPASPNIMFSFISGRNIKDMTQGMVFALVLISFVLILALRSWKLGLLSLIPNLAPMGLAFGTWYFFVGEINFTMAVALGMTLGIVVDDTVHFLTKYLRAKREQGLSTEESVRYAFTNVGNALLVMSIVIAAGFMVLAQSHFLANSGLAKLTVLAIIFALFADFLMLPALLLLADKDKKKVNQEEIAS